MNKNGTSIAVPNDASIRIVSDTDKTNGDYDNGISVTINNDGTFTYTTVKYNNTYKEGNIFQVVVFKNHVEPERIDWNSNEDVYKYVGGAEQFNSWSNITVKPSDFQNRQ